MSEATVDLLSLSAERRVDDVCLRFENALKASEPTRIESYLDGVAEPEHTSLLRELMRLEIDYRQSRGDKPTMEEYQVRFPDHASTIAGWYSREATIDLPTRNAAPQPWPNVQGYEIVSELGHGGMGIVYQAKHLKFDRIVALKMIRAGEHASTDQTERFVAEARAVAKLQHPNIVQIHEFG